MDDKTREQPISVYNQQHAWLAIQWHIAQALGELDLLGEDERASQVGNHLHTIVRLMMNYDGECDPVRLDPEALAWIRRHLEKDHGRQD